MPDLKAFDRPVRIIFGEEDPYLNPGVARSLHEALPTSDLWLLPKQGHWPQLGGPFEVAQLLLSLPGASRVPAKSSARWAIDSTDGPDSPELERRQR